MTGPRLPRLALVGNYAPRQCGIATFTTDLTEALTRTCPATRPFAVALSDRPGYTYPERVRLELNQEDRQGYRDAAAFLNASDADAVIVQHEYGIYGGESGRYLLELLRRLKLPAVTTFHTILEHPTLSQRDVLTEVAARSQRVVTMSLKGYEFLQTVYGVPQGKIDFIHHGVPDVPFDLAGDKRRFGLAGKQVLLTFGLLSQNKGLEVAIRALPGVVREHPDVLYLVLGATHPHVLQHEGEAYRDRLKALAQELGVGEHVRFENTFVSIGELLGYLAVADLYVTPYLNREQITSGTLAYALGMGKAVVSTPYWYAEELLAERRGVLVPFGDGEAMAGAFNRLLSDPTERAALRRRAYAYGRTMTWAQGAKRYLASVRKALDSSKSSKPRLVLPPRALPAPRPADPSLPDLRLSHVETLTDDTGIFQHATYSVPNPHEGYTTDDNARALMLTTLAETPPGAERDRLQALSHRYLTFLLYAFNAETGRFRNFMSFDRRWLEAVGSENAHARALRALSWAQRYSCHEGLRRAAARLFDESLGAACTFTSPRAWALTLLALCEGPDSLKRRHRSLAQDLARHLTRLCRQNVSDHWHWLEDHLCYSNAKLPHALVLYGQEAGDEQALALGLRTLAWLADVQRGPTGFFEPVGSDRVYRSGESKPHFDQQPVEAYASLSAYLAAYRATEESGWKREADRAMGWFFGTNMLGLPLYDKATGGCFDGLHPGRVNQNQGAESTLALWLAVLEFQLEVDLTLPPFVAGD